MHKGTKSPINQRKPLVLAIAFAMAFSANATMAQDAEEEFAGLEEVIVTATKRAESLQEVPMAITAISDKELERMGAVVLLDFAVRVPNLAMAYEADGRFDSSSPSIRGVFGVNTTGFYIDDTPVNASMLPRVVDLERIEVLRGPQGSLWGAKSMGGVIRMVTKQADLVNADSMVHASLSTVDDGDQNWNFDGVFNIPLIEDKFAIRINGYYGSVSGIFDREYLSTWEDSSGTSHPNPGPAFDKNENVDDEKYWGGQIAAKWALTDSLDLDMRVMTQKVEADGLPLADGAPGNTTELRWFDSEEPGTDEWTIASATFNWSPDAGNLVSTTSWYDRETDESEEEHTFLNFLLNYASATMGLPADVPIPPIEAVISTVEKYESFVHETRFSSDNDGAWNYTVGIFYQDAEWDHHYPPSFQPGLNDFVNDYLYDYIGGDINVAPGDVIFVTQTDTKTEELAFFGELTAQVALMRNKVNPALTPRFWCRRTSMMTGIFTAVLPRDSAWAVLTEIYRLACAAMSLMNWGLIRRMPRPTTPTVCGVMSWVSSPR